MYEADLLKYVSSNFWQQKLDQKSTYIVIRKSYLSYKSNFFILFFASTKILHWTNWSIFTCWPIHVCICICFCICICICAFPIDFKKCYKQLWWGATAHRLSWQYGSDFLQIWMIIIRWDISWRIIMRWGVWHQIKSYHVADVVSVKRSWARNILHGKTSQPVQRWKHKITC